MIRSKEELYAALRVEMPFYGLPTGGGRLFLSRLKNWIFSSNVSIGEYVRTLRFTEYYHNNSFHKTGKKINFPYDIMYVFYHRRYMKLSAKLNLEIGLNACDVGLHLYHYGCIVNYTAIVGKNVRLHGMNCIGNNDKGVPVIGNNVELGVGASIIGNVHIADNVRIGAGAVVVKDVLEVGATVVGIPAHSI